MAADAFVQYQPPKLGVDLFTGDAQYQLANNRNLSAADTRNLITRLEYRDYVNRFQPIERQLADQYRDVGMYDRFMNKAREATDRQFMNAVGALKRSQQRYGITLTPRQEAAQRRGLALAKGSATVANVNAMRQGVYDEKQRLVAGG